MNENKTKKIEIEEVDDLGETYSEERRLLLEDAGEYAWRKRYAVPEDSEIREEHFADTIQYKRYGYVIAYENGIGLWEQDGTPAGGIASQLGPAVRMYFERKGNRVFLIKKKSGKIINKFVEKQE